VQDCEEILGRYAIAGDTIDQARLTSNASSVLLQRSDANDSKSSNIHLEVFAQAALEGRSI
jgi:hypothetical protein